MRIIYVNCRHAELNERPSTSGENVASQTERKRQRQVDQVYKTTISIETKMKGKEKL